MDKRSMLEKASCSTDTHATVFDRVSAASYAMELMEIEGPSADEEIVRCGKRFVQC